MKINLTSILTCLSFKTFNNWLLILVFSSITIQSYAQRQFWGFSGGGTDQLGSISSFTPATTDLVTEHSFDYITLGNTFWNNQLTDGGNGKFYGIGHTAYSYNLSVWHSAIYEWDPVTNVYTRKLEIGESNGYGGNMVLYNGKFYFMSNGGGAYDYGAIYEWNPVSNVLTKKIDFDGTNGRFPLSNTLTEYGGKFYGMTQHGGIYGNAGSDYGYGVIFEWDPSTNIYTKKYDFDGTNGRNPYGTLTQFGGKFYGTASNGGLNDKGVIFEWDPATNVYTNKYDCDGANGFYPTGTLALNGNKLYGLAKYGAIGWNVNGSYGNGVLFEYDPSLNTYTKKVEFSGTNGREPVGFLTYHAGKFFGTTYYGGISASGNNPGFGVLFEWDPVINVYTKKHDFDGTNGAFPHSSLAILAGNLYGITSNGGQHFGVMYEWNNSTNTFTKKRDCGITDGHYPSGSLTLNNNKFYGATSIGGANGTYNNYYYWEYGYGTLFEFDPAANTYTKKFDFNGLNGQSPLGSLTFYNGKFYGVTQYGGLNGGSFYNGAYSTWYSGGYGVIFEWDPLTNIYTKKIDFDNTNGKYPNSALTLLNNKFYGTTYQGGTNNYGVLFEWDPATNAFIKKHDFEGYPGINGVSPTGPLAVFNNKIYGMAFGGTNGLGVIYEYDPATNSYTKKIDFDGLNGSSPYGGLTLRNNKFYGTTPSGGTGWLNNGNQDDGVIFEWDPTTNIYTKKYDFDLTTGSNPNGALLLSQDKFYGTTFNGGAYGYGALFEWDPESNTYNKLKDFTTNSAYGYYNYAGSSVLTEYYKPTTQWFLDADDDGYYVGSAVIQGSSPGTNYKTEIVGADDCDDTDPLAHSINTIWYLDADGDHYVTGSGITQCLRPAIGYISTGILPGTDCDDNNPLAYNNNTVWYLDADADHYYSGSPATQCHSPGPGYTSSGIIDGGDCNDNNAAVHPGVLEIPGNNIDDNCNGGVDENNALHFDGANDYVISQFYAPGTTTSLSINTGELTLSAWIKKDIGSTDGQIFERNAAYGLRVNSNNQLQYTSGLNGITYAAFGIIPIGIWVHVAVSVVNQTSATFYINGVNVGTSTDPYQTFIDPTTTSHLIMGQGFLGSIDEICIWNMARTQAQIQADFCNVDNLSAGLIAHYSFNQGTANANNAGVNTVLDSKGNHTGTMSNFTLSGTTSNWVQSFEFFEDLDGDGYGSNVPVACSITASTTNTDCAINNNSIWQSALLYTDADGDGYDVGSAVTCYGATLPTGLSLTTNGPDCDDLDPSVHNGNQQWILDADNDNYYVGSIVTSCPSPGVYYKQYDLNTHAPDDCDDNDALVQYNVTWYMDFDGDLYSTGNAIVSCHSPGLGYTSDIYNLLGEGDCNDNDINVNPGIIEIENNGIDDNCNGYVDEDYCIPVVEALCNTAVGAIIHVSLGTISNSSSYNGYSDYSTTQAITASPGDVINFNITPDNYSQKVSIYIDYNHDGSFNLSEERVADAIPMWSFSTNAIGTFTIPINQAIGEYRIRIISDGDFITSNNPCQSYAGEAEDYTLIVASAPLVYCTPVIDLPCSQQPISNVTIGTINNNSGCNGYTDYSFSQSTTALQGATVNFSISKGTSLTGGESANIFIDYNNDGDFDESGELVAFNVYMQTTPQMNAEGSFIIPISQPPGNYRIRVVSDYYPITEPDPCYTHAGEVEDYMIKIICNPVITNSCSLGWITNVALGTINNASACSINGFEDYSVTQSTSALPGATINYTVSAGGNTNNDQVVSIFIDYNNNGEFDATEKVADMILMNNYDPLDATGSFTLPTTLSPGNYRVRVISDDASITNSEACNSSSGEAEDYTLTIISCLNELTWFFDCDGDRYYTGSGITSCNSPGYHYISNPLGGNDCNDYDNSVWLSNLLYIDNDGDGLNVGSATICYGATVPTGYSITTNGGDCDDTDPFNLVTNGATLPLSEDFEGANDPPTGWTNIDNETPGKAWVKTSDAGGFGLSVHSMMFNNYNFNVPGEKDEIQVKRLDFTGITAATLTFDVAYMQYPNASDELVVRVSTDCGTTFTNVYSKAGSVLSTAGTGSGNFIPTSSQWRTETVDLTAFVGLPSVIIQFQNINDFGNKLYIDNVNVSGTGGGCIPPTLPTISASSTINCGSENTTLSIATGSLNSATNWIWYSGSCNGTSVGSGSSINVSPTSTTDYFVRGEGGCVTPGSCATQTITVNTPIIYYLDVDGDNYGVTSDFQLLCAASGNYRSTIGGDCNDNDIDINPAATEICNGIDDNCNGQIDETCCSINLSGAITTVECKGYNTGAINVTSSNMYGTPTYIWNNGNTNEDLSNLFASTYTVTVSYFTGCSASASYVVSQPESILSISLAKVSIRCAGKSSGQITALPSGGVPPYFYLWSNGATTSKIAGITLGYYTVTITDSEGCAKSKTTLLTQNPAMLLMITPSADSATAQATGGISPYSYYWKTTPVQTTSTATGLSSGESYKVKVTDNKGCTKIGTIVMPTSKYSGSSNDENFIVFPNPTNGFITIAGFSESNAIIKITLQEATGRIIIQSLESASAGFISKDFSHLSYGVYMLTIEAGDKRKTIKLIFEE